MSSIAKPVLKSAFIPKNPTTDKTDGGNDPSTTFKRPYPQLHAPAMHCAAGTPCIPFSCHFSNSLLHALSIFVVAVVW